MNCPSSLSRLLLGPVPERHAAIGLTLMVSVLYLFNAGLVLVSLPLGYVSPVMTPYSIACMLFGAGVFYGLLRSGLSQRYTDPHMVLAQSVYFAFAVAVGYMTVNANLRGVVLAFMPAIFLPGQFALPERKIRHLALMMIALLLGVTVLNRIVEPEEQQTVGDLMRCIFLSAVLLASSLVAQRVSRTHHDMKAKSEALAIALHKVEHLASHDQLTGLINRHRMHDILDKEWQRQQRQHRPTTLVMMDLDHFKRVNDSLGHQVGDKVLQQLAIMADTYLRDADVVSRWGGEEFLVLCPESTGDQAIVALHRLRDQLHRMPLVSEHPELRVTFSAGLATLRPGEAVDNAIERADQALYQAKEAGRDRFIQSP